MEGEDGAEIREEEEGGEDEDIDEEEELEDQEQFSQWELLQMQRVRGCPARGGHVVVSIGAARRRIGRFGPAFSPATMGVRVRHLRTTESGNPGTDILPHCSFRPC